MSTTPPSQRYSFSFHGVSVDLQEAWKTPNARGIQSPNLLNQDTWKKIETFYTSIFELRQDLLPASSKKLSEIGCSRIGGDHFLNTFFQDGGIHEHKQVKLSAAQVTVLNDLRAQYSPLMMEMPPLKEVSTLKFQPGELTLDGSEQISVAVEINRKNPEVDTVTIANIGIKLARQQGLINFPPPSECKASWFAPNRPHPVRIFHDVGLATNATNAINTPGQELLLKRYPLHFEINSNLQKIDGKQAPYYQHFNEGLITTGDKDPTVIFLQDGYEITEDTDNAAQERPLLMRGIARQLKRYLSIQQEFRNSGKKEITIKESLGEFDNHLQTCTTVFIRMVAMYALNTYSADKPHKTQVNLDLETSDKTLLLRKITKIRERIITFQTDNLHPTIEGIVDDFLDQDFHDNLNQLPEVVAPVPVDDNPVLVPVVVAPVPAPVVVAPELADADQVPVDVDQAVPDA